MRLLVVSHKETWATNDGVFTVGGFPRQMTALSELFDETVVMATARRGLAPGGLEPLIGRHLSTRLLAEPRGHGFVRKLLLPIWLARNLREIWRAMTSADVVHALVPGDVGSLGLAIAWLRGKRLFVRHCGTWGNRVTVADRLLAAVLPRLAGANTVVMATGGGARPPSPGRPLVEWIFATSMTKRELAELPFVCRWTPERPLRLVTVSRLVAGKNTRAAVAALPSILERHPEASLDIVGDGPDRERLAALACRLGLADRARFHGNVSHRKVLEILCDSSLFVFPTQVAEGCPKALVEALACSLPVIATGVSVVPSLLANGAGLVLDDPTASNVAEACLAATANEADYRRMASCAHTAAAGLSLEDWRDSIGERLTAAWGTLKQAPLTGTSGPRDAEP